MLADENWLNLDEGLDEEIQKWIIYIYIFTYKIDQINYTCS